MEIDDIDSVSEGITKNRAKTWDQLQPLLPGHFLSHLG